MAIDNSEFKFTDAVSVIDPAELTAIIPAGIHDTDVLLKAISDGLDFPSYFGYNWNALYDCLCDLTWTDREIVKIVHCDIPQIPEIDLPNYIETLRDAIRCWNPGEQHQLVVEFPASAKLTIERIKTK